MNSQASWSAERKHATGSSTDVSLDVGRSAVHPDTFGHLKNARARRLGGLEAPLELVPIDGAGVQEPAWLLGFRVDEPVRPDKV